MQAISMAWWNRGMEDGMVGGDMEAEDGVVGGDVVFEVVGEGLVVEICRETQVITMVMVHQDHFLARVVVSLRFQFSFFFP